MQGPEEYSPRLLNLKLQTKGAWRRQRRGGSSGSNTEVEAGA